MRAFTERNPLGRRVSRRFVAGLTLADAIAAVRAVNAAGLSATLDPLGENVSHEAEARRAAEQAVQILETIQHEGVDSNLSIKLTQLGLDLGRELALENLRRIARVATANGSFVRVDMEGSAYTAITLELVEQARGENFSVGTVLQSYLHRSEADLSRLLERGVRVRLVKGAYREPAAIAFQQKPEVDANYLRLMQRLLADPGYHAIATHDERIIAATVARARELGKAADGFEFQMLYGIRRDLQDRLRAEGWRVRVYIPFGADWYPYFMRRLAERPANLLFLARNLFR